MNDERVIATVSCDACGEPANAPCVNYPSGQPAAKIHSMRLFKAYKLGVLPWDGTPFPTDQTDY